MRQVPRYHLLFFALFTALLPAQTSSPAQPSFDVASVKPNNSGGGGSSESTGPGHVTATNISVNSMLMQAFGIRPFQIVGGPGWLSDNYDLVATTGTTKDLNELELRPYFESLLQERFQLRYHRESKEMQVYSMVVAKNGVQMTRHQGEGDTSTNGSNSAGKSAVTSTNITMGGLAGVLGRRLDRVVLDNTGLPGGYDLHLEWSAEPAVENSGPSIFAALQEQLGLKLDSTKGAVEFIVIDHIEKPSEN